MAIRVFFKKKIEKKYVNKEICYFEPIANAFTKNDRLKKLYERADIGRQYFFNFERILFNINQLRLVIKFKYFWKYT